MYLIWLKICLTKPRFISSRRFKLFFSKFKFGNNLHLPQFELTFLLFWLFFGYTLPLILAVAITYILWTRPFHEDAPISPLLLFWHFNSSTTLSLNWPFLPSNLLHLATLLITHSYAVSHFPPIHLFSPISLLFFSSFYTFPANCHSLNFTLLLEMGPDPTRPKHTFDLPNFPNPNHRWLIRPDPSYKKLTQPDPKPILFL